MSTYPAGSHRVDLHLSWPTGETGAYEVDVIHERDLTREQVLVAAMHALRVQRGHELPDGAPTWSGVIR
jgi:hypothetical protein